jgi:UDP-glucose 4-epimerase|tara:strand:+ start:1095 stop:2027 length:933 start_codon:yes stop_codon:yes gene_type:complete
MSNVLITGGSGFIGSHISDRLLDANKKVVVIDNYQTGRKDNLKPHDNLTVIEDSIVNYNLLEDIFKEHNIDTVIHAAASYKDPDNWIEDAKTNVEGTINLVRLSLKYKINKFIYFQTALCYGIKPLENPITLSHPILPEGSSYAISKTTAEQYIHLSGLNHVTFRLANVYGPRNISGPLPTFFQRIQQNKACFTVNTRRDFVYVDDLVKVVIKAVNGNVEGTFHISSGKDIAIKEMWDSTLKALNIEYDVEERERNPDDAPSILLDPTLTNETFDWCADTPLNVGIENTITYYKEYGINETFTHLTNKPK